MILFTAVLVTAHLAEGAPRWLRLSWAQTDGTDTTMTVSWNDDDAGGGTVEFRPLDGTVSTMSADMLATGSGLLDNTYEATMTGLMPSTTYEYRVQSGGSWSEWKRFTTAPPLGTCSPFRIVVGGDGRGGEAFYDPGFVSRHWDNIAGYIRNEMPLMFIESGDIVHEGDQDEQWESWFSISDFFTAEIPFMAVMGNHDNGPGDGDSQWYNKMYAFPRSGAGSFDATVDPEGDGIEDFWALVMGNVLLVGLSTEGVVPSIQHAFLQDVVSEWDARVDWKLLFFHRPLWSSGAHGSNEEDKLDAAGLIALIDDYGFDFALTGHDHDYERFHPSRGGYGGRPRVITPLPDDGGNSGEADGTIHIVTGGAGSFTNFAMFCRVDGCFVCSGHLNYMVFDFLGDRVDVIVRDLGPILTLAEATMQPVPIDVFHVYKSGSICDIIPDDVPEEILEPVDVPDLPDSADATVDAAPDPADDAAVEADGPAADAAPDAALPDGQDDGPEEPGGKEGCGCRLVTA
jgi:hypothetical protein